jgi:hypothetical protein
VIALAYSKEATMSQGQREILSIDPLDGYAPEIGRWLWALEDTRSRTKQSLEGVSATVIDWLPGEGGNSIGTLLYHIGAIELDWLFVDVLGQAFPPDLEALFADDVRDDRGNLTNVPGVGLAEHMRRLDEVRATLLASFRGMTIEEFRRPRQLPTYGVTPEWVLHHLNQHEAEHCGQIAELRSSAERMPRLA